MLASIDIIIVNPDDCVSFKIKRQSETLNTGCGQAMGKSLQ
jgi:hypothetical protein